MEGMCLSTARPCVVSSPPLAETSRFLNYDSGFSALRFCGFGNISGCVAKWCKSYAVKVLIASIRDQPASPPAAINPCLQLPCGHLRIRQGNLRAAGLQSSHQHANTQARRWDRAPRILLDLITCGKPDLNNTSSSGLGSLRDREHMCSAGISSHHGPLFVVSPDVFPSPYPTSRRTSRWTVSSSGWFLRIRPGPSNLFTQVPSPLFILDV